MNNSDNVLVAQTILEQLGNGRFKMMTGAKNFVAVERGLTFRLPGANFCKNNINFVSVVLTPADTYTVTFSRVRGGTITQVSQHNDIYFDMLRELFTNETGLALSLCS